jgi:cyclomaltodextrinase/neopullulanase
MNYLFAGPTIAFAAGDRVVLEQVQNRDYQPYPPLFAKEYAEKIEELLKLYPWEIQLTQLNLLASHDTARLLTIAGGDRASVELSTLLLLTFPGAPSIYYGDEVGLPGALDPDSRRGFPAESDWDREIYDYHHQLIALRHAYPALRTGDYRMIYAEGTTYIFARILDNQELLIAVNVGTVPVKAYVDWSQTQLNSKPNKLLFGQVELDWTEGDEIRQLELNLPARSGCVLVEV